MARASTRHTGLIEKLKSWFIDYKHWLETSPQGISERTRPNNHGTYFALQMISIAQFLNDSNLLNEIIHSAQDRILSSFSDTGDQVFEKTRTLSKHYYVFNLHGWSRIMAYARASDMPFEQWGKEHQNRIVTAFNWLLTANKTAWPYTQISPYDSNRIYPLLMHADQLGLLQPQHIVAYEDYRKHATIRHLNPSTAGINSFDIHPWWNLPAFTNL